jgi:RNA polymerase sigma factor (sigma-70 family)
MPTRLPHPLPWADAVHDPDSVLLRRYAADRDGAAFAVLVRRHGPVVFGVCLRAAGHRHDAEDAFQATFLILARKAAVIARPELLGNWLYGVAYRVARKAKRAAARRRHREAAVADVPPPTPAAGWSDAATVIDDELNRLADHHRSAVLLCDVQGLSRADAAKRLGIAEGTLSSRLNAARKKLADRLTRRGVTLSAAGVGVVLSERATAAVPDEVVRRLHDLLPLAHLPAAISGPVGELIREGLAMRTKLWAGVAAVGLAASGVAMAAWPGDEPKPDVPKAAKADEPKAEAKPDGDKAKKPAKPKLIDTIRADGTLSSPMWQGDGKTLYVSHRDTRSGTPFGLSQAVRTFEMRGYTQPKIDGGGWQQDLVFECPTGGFLGFYNSGKSFATYTPAGRRINAPDMVDHADIVSRGIGVPGQLVVRQPGTQRIEIDLDDGRPFAISPDGKTVFAQKVTEGVTRVVTVNLLDAMTGELTKTVGTFGGDGQSVRAYKLSHAADRLFVYLHTDDEVTVRCVEVASGKTVWDAKFPSPRPVGEQPGRPSSVETRLLNQQFLTASRDGKRLGVMVGTDAEQKVFDLKVLDATTGMIAVKLADLGSGGNTALDFSHDGRMLVGKTDRIADDMTRMALARGALSPDQLAGPDGKWQQLVVWDLKTGKVLRAWNDNLNVSAAFAPDRPVLAIVETEREITGSVPAAQPAGAGGAFQPGRGERLVPQYQYRSTIGFWDLSPLLK